MKVFKFGGASIGSADRIRHVANILRQYTGQPILVIVSAMGKTTNALEKVAAAFYAGDQAQALQHFAEVKTAHLALLEELLPGGHGNAELLADFFTETEWLLHDKPVRDYDYYYDQVVCCGELLSTAIISAFFNRAGLDNQWLDVRDIVRTDDNFRDAAVDWDVTRQKVQTVLQPLLSHRPLVITQGFIGATDENESTTLGREGSDYSAAVFANLLDAESQTIWKDVEGVMNADPKAFADAQLMPHLSFTEVIEMAYYGAQVIHPKTIKPLQNKNIPLHVKCFLKPELPGTVIDALPAQGLPPVIILKENQVLLQLSSKDFSFVGETGISQLYQLFAQFKIKPNLTQNGAISIVCCLDDRPEKIEKLALAASVFFDVSVQKNLTLLTIRHYTPQKIALLTAGKTILLEQKTTETVQVLMLG
jgi:aspartate kinase